MATYVPIHLRVTSDTPNARPKSRRRTSSSGIEVSELHVKEENTDVITGDASDGRASPSQHSAIRDSDNTIGLGSSVDNTKCISNSGQHSPHDQLDMTAEDLSLRYQDAIPTAYPPDCDSISKSQTALDPNVTQSMSWKLSSGNVVCDNPTTVTRSGSRISTPSHREYAKAFKKYQGFPVVEAQKPKPSKQVSGWLTKEEKRAMAITLDDLENHQMGVMITYNDSGWGKQDQDDWNAPHQLVDWEGKILPAPVEWDGRRPCSRDDWCHFMLQYLRENQPWFKQRKNGTHKSYCVIDMSHKLFSAGDNGEVAPRDWIPEIIEDQTLQSFWKSLLQTTPQPVDDDDLDGQAFWLRYVAETNMLLPYEHRNSFCKPVSDVGHTSAEIEHFRLWRQSKHQTSDNTAREFASKQSTKETQVRHALRMAKMKREDAAKEPEVILPPNPHRLRANIYLRAMNIETDAQGVYDIYEHYANETVYVSELKAPELQGMISRLQDIKATQMPMIVAVERKPKSKKSIVSEEHKVEKILGFAFADEDEGRHTQMSYVAALEVYVHAEYQSKGIGTSLLDRMLWLLDPMYHCVGDTKWKPPADQPEFHSPGGKRVVSTVRIPLYYSDDERARCMWIKEWLKIFGFEMQADFSKCGIKLQKWTRQAIFQRETGQTLDPETIVRSFL